MDLLPDEGTGRICGIRDEICIYDTEIQDAKLLHIQMQPTNDGYITN